MKFLDGSDRVMIERDSKVRLKIVGTFFDATDHFCIGIKKCTYNFRKLLLILGELPYGV